MCKCPEAPQSLTHTDLSASQTSPCWSLAAPVTGPIISTEGDPGPDVQKTRLQSHSALLCQECLDIDINALRGSFGIHHLVLQPPTHLTLNERV